MTSVTTNAPYILPLTMSLLLGSPGSAGASPATDTGIFIHTASDTLHVASVDIESSPFFLEGNGSFTTSTGTVVTGHWAGLSLPGLLASHVNLNPDDSVVFIASDGYEMTNSAAGILDESEGTWIVAWMKDGDPLSDDYTGNRTIKVGPTDPNIRGHTSVRDIVAIRIHAETFRDFTITIRGMRHETVDRQTVQSCVGCHGASVTAKVNNDSTTYIGIPLHRFLAYADDSLFIPHAQDVSVPSYRADRARTGYPVLVHTADGDSLPLDSRSLHSNDLCILGYYRDGTELGEEEAPLVLVGSGGKSIHMPRIQEIVLHFDGEN